jgi:hypothetical protein
VARATSLTAAQAAAIANVDRRTIVNWCQAARFDCSLIGGVWMINERSFFAFLGNRLACK